ncbi:MAG: DNA-binding response regulator [Deltaproteobacteria bacterium]|nr:MAG: DNA-binding response regulator [Deltaproteobacteria bacterium]
MLIVDDEADLRQLLDINLSREGFQVLHAPDGETALSLALEQRPSLIILDMMLPDLSGTEVCRRLRAEPKTAALPIIMLSARGEEIDRVVGFEVGADDYVVKSNLSTRELVLRIRALLRRQGGASPAKQPAMTMEPRKLRFGVIALEPESHRVWVSDEEVSLTVTEFRLLTSLVERANRVRTRGNLLQDVWDMPPDLNTRTVDTHVKRLREKLGDAAAHIETVRGVGYRFNTDPS